MTNLIVLVLRDVNVGGKFKKLSTDEVFFAPGCVMYLECLINGLWRSLLGFSDRVGGWHQCQVNKVYFWITIGLLSANR